MTVTIVHHANTFSPVRLAMHNQTSVYDLYTLSSEQVPQHVLLNVFYFLLCESVDVQWMQVLHYSVDQAFRPATAPQSML